MDKFEVIKKECDYYEWIKEHEKEVENKPTNKPSFSIVLFGNKVTKKQKRRCIHSIKMQKNSSVQIIIIEDRVIKWNEIKRQLSGEYSIFMNMNDWLSENALLEVAMSLKDNSDSQWIYSDEDVFREEDGRRILPQFKPDWSKETFISHFYTGNLAVYKTAICSKIVDWEMPYSSYWGYDFAFRFLEVCDCNKIVHIPKVLYHASSENVSKCDVSIILKQIKGEYVRRNGIDAYIEKEENTGQFRIVYNPNEFVSIVIPSKDNAEMLLDCIKSIENNTSYTNYEIIVVDNGSKENNREILKQELESKNIKYIYRPMEFNFSKMCNIGAQTAVGQHVLFLNDDIECIDDKWLERMLGQSEQSGIGAVGAKLLYPEGNKIQHLGVVNLSMGPSHILSGQNDEEILENGRNYLDYNYEAVTAACMMVKKSVFDEVNGFDESFPIAYNDIDFCYRLREMGLRNVVRTDAVLIHHESISRGLDVIDKVKNNRLEMERKRLYEIHPWIVGKCDKSYSPNYSQDWTDFRLHKKAYKSLKCHDMKKLWYKGLKKNVIIEELAVNKTIHIRGWVRYKNDQITNLSDIYVVLKKGKDEIWYKARKQYRSDVAAALSNFAVYSGFECDIQEEIEVLRGCKVGVYIDVYNRPLNVLVWSDMLVK